MLLHTNGKLTECHLIILYLLLTQCLRGESQLFHSPQTIIATLGHDIILPCHLVPGEDASDLTLEWTRPDLNPRFVHVCRSGQELVDKKHELFKKRTSLFTDELKLGNISLKLSKVKIHDKGTFRCFIPEKQKQSFVQLVVGSDAVTSPIITLAGIDKATNGVNLQCNSEGWYPEPVVFWLDGKGNVLSAGPTETIRGPDDLYTVSSRVTVEKRHSNNFTCRVQQKIMNQTREAHIHVSDVFYNFQSSSSSITIGLAVSLAVCLFLSTTILLLLFFLWKWRQNTIKIKKSPEIDKEENCNSNSTKTEGEMEQLMTDETVQKEVFNKGKGQKEIKHTPDKLQELQEKPRPRKKETENHKSKVFDRQNSQKVSHTTMTSQVSATGDIIVDKVDPEGKHGHLRSMSKKPEIHKSKVFDRQNSQKVSHTTMTGSVSAMEESKLFDGQNSQKVSHTTMTGPVSATGDIIVDKVDPEGKYVRLKNISTKFQSMKDWELHIQVNNRKPIMHTFNSEFGLRRGNTVTIWTKKSDVIESPTDLVTLKSWGIGEQLLVTLYRDTGKCVISEAQNLVNCGTSLASQDSVTGHINVDEVDPEGKYVCLKNMSDKEQQMKDWELHMQVDNRKPIIISTFDCRVHLNPGQSVTIWAKNFAFMREPGDLLSSNSWGTGKQLLVTLYSDTGEKVSTKNV